MKKTIVIKIGGSTLGQHDTTMEDLVELQKRGLRVVVIHGGGKIISEWLTKMGWTFKSKETCISEFVRFNSVYVIIFIVNAITLIILVDILSINPKIGQLVTLPIITIISFMGHRRWSFNGKRTAASNPLE